MFKKMVVAVIVIIMAISMTACGQKQEEATHWTACEYINEMGLSMYEFECLLERSGITYNRLVCNGLPGYEYPESRTKEVHAILGMPF